LLFFAPTHPNRIRISGWRQWGLVELREDTIKNQIFKFRETQWVSMAQTWMKLAEAAERLQPHQGAKGRGW
jgi:hypothetical protein